MTFSIYQLEHLIEERSITRPPDSHTVKKLDAGHRQCAKKFGEEAVELLIEVAGADNSEESRTAIVREAADSLYYFLLLLRTQNISFRAIEHELALRHTQQSGCPKLDRKGT